jgi:choline dehydrogenase
VLLLEAGGEEPPQADVPAFTPLNWGTRFDWQYETEPDEGYCAGKPCMWNAGKVLGGGSVLNGMVYNRGNGRSYDIWKEMGKCFNLSFLTFTARASYRLGRHLTFTGRKLHLL